LWNSAYHLKCISLKGHEEKIVREAIHAKFEAIEKQILLLQTENTQLKSEIAQLQPLLDAVMKVEQAIQQLQEGFGEMALMVHTLQATRCRGGGMRQGLAKPSPSIQLLSTLVAMVTSSVYGYTWMVMGVGRAPTSPSSSLSCEESTMHC